VRGLLELLRRPQQVTGGFQRVAEQVAYGGGVAPRQDAAEDLDRASRLPGLDVVGGARQVLVDRGVGRRRRQEGGRQEQGPASHGRCRRL
jgi:hypothetical protein